MTTAIVKQELNMNTWSMIQEIALSAKNSAKLNLFRSEEAAIKMLVAWENGLPLTSAFGNVYIINNIPALSPKAIWAKVIVHPEFAGYKEEILTDAKGGFLGYKITLKRKNGVEATRQFTLEDAKRAKLDTKDNWQSYPQNMCFWRACSFVEDVVFPDVTMGVVTADALGADLTPDGNVIDAVWTQTPASAPQNGATGQSAQAPQTTMSTVATVDPSTLLNELVQKYGAEKVLIANEGRIPATMEDLQATRVKLEKGQ